MFSLECELFLLEFISWEEIEDCNELGKSPGDQVELGKSPGDQVCAKLQGSF